MNIGQSVLSGGAVRMRLYTGWGMGPGDVTRIIGFNFMIGTVGQLLLIGLLFTFVGYRIPDSVEVPFHSLRLVGVVALLLVGAFFVAVGRKRRWGLRC